MKLIKAAKDHYQFQLGHRENDLLQQVLSLYPCIPAGYQPLSKARMESNQELLDEALAEARGKNKQQLEALLADPQRLKRTENGWRLSLTSEQVEWLLQVLNDVRIGIWLRLGSPEMPMSALKAQNAPHFWAMETAGYFQMRFLELLGG